jgi:hypothetical protein
MTPQNDEKRGQTTCAFDVSPDVVDAGAEMTLHGRVSCSPSCDLRGHALLIKDHDGADVGTLELTEFDGEANETSDLVLKAPGTAGEYTWLAVSPAVVKKGVSYSAASTPIPFTVKPHATRIVVWDIPSAVVVGEKFRMKVGIKCSNECHLTNKEFGIYDAEGKQKATATLPGEHWPGTTGLYVAEVELEAPSAEALYTWTVKCPGSDAGIPHAEGSINFGVRVVSRPEYLVKVETVDKDNQTPLMGARVVMHPYRAVTDERGIAEVRVAKGEYKLFVSQTRYVTFGLPVEVTADMTARAELELEPVTERN